jgi:hypothetical protein
VAPIGFGKKLFGKWQRCCAFTKEEKTSKEQQQRKWCAGKGLEFGIERRVYETHRRRFFWINIGRWVTWPRAAIIKKSA